MRFRKRHLTIGSATLAAWASPVSRFVSKQRSCTRFHHCETTPTGSDDSRTCTEIRGLTVQYTLSLLTRTTYPLPKWRAFEFTTVNASPFRVSSYLQTASSACLLASLSELPFWNWVLVRDSAPQQRSWDIPVPIAHTRSMTEVDRPCLELLGRGTSGHFRPSRIRSRGSSFRW